MPRSRERKYTRLYSKVRSACRRCAAWKRQRAGTRLSSISDRQLPLEPRADPNSERRAGAEKSRVAEILEDLARVAEHAEGFVALVEYILDTRKQHDVVVELPFGAQIHDRVAVCLVEQIGLVPAQVDTRAHHYVGAHVEAIAQREVDAEIGLMLRNARNVRARSHQQLLLADNRG